MKPTKIKLVGKILSNLVIALVFHPVFMQAMNLPALNDWPQWRGPNRNGTQATDDAFRFPERFGIKLSWKKALGSGYSSVSVAGDHAVTMFSDSTFDFLIAFDAGNGSELWRINIDSTYIGHDGSHNGPLSTPLIHDRTVFALGPKGTLLAADLRTGAKIWSRHLRNENLAQEPYYGFTTAPIVMGDVLILQTGGDERAVSGFDKNTGKLRWAVGSDNMNYQSPISANINGEEQLLAVGGEYLFGLNPATGDRLWEFRHEGGDSQINPVDIGTGQIFMRHERNRSMLLEIKTQDRDYSIEAVWSSNATRFSYNTHVFHEGHFYGYNRRFLSCVDAATGKLAWRSREPDDGFLIIVDGYLVIQTKKGSMHIAKASPQGYEEMASLKVFDGLSWALPAFANDNFYVRSLSEIACIEVSNRRQLSDLRGERDQAFVAADSKFARFIKKLEAASNKETLIDNFMTAQAQFPVIEGNDLVHFVYRGEENDMSIIGDMIDSADDVYLRNVAGTDFYYASLRLEPDARVNYRFESGSGRILDPLNPNKAPQFFGGDASELAMPEWQRPAHLNKPAIPLTSRMDTLDFESQILDETREVSIYLPPDYDQNRDHLYPTLYVNFGRSVLRKTHIRNTLDNLIGKTVASIIVIFISETRNLRQEYLGDSKDPFLQMMTRELIPYIDESYRTIPRAESRVIMGAAHAGILALYAAFTKPDFFGNAACQTPFIIPPADMELAGHITNSTTRPGKLYLDWSKYEYRRAFGSYDLTEGNRTLAKLLEDKGHNVAAYEFNDGFGWANWRNRTDKILETFFPMN